MPGDYFSQQELIAIERFTIPQLQQVLNLCKDTPEKADEIKHQLGLRYAQTLEYQTALNYFEEAAKNQHTEASYYAAMFYQKNWGTTLDLRERQHKALIYFQQAAQNNHSRALEALGTIYRDGLGTEIDLEKAWEYYTQSKTPSARTALGVMYRADTLPQSKILKRPDRLAQAQDHFEQAAQLPLAQYQLALLLEQVAHEDHDDELFPKIIALYTSAAQTLPEAQFELAWVYYKGLCGKEINVQKALALYKGAAERGHTAAQAEYAYLLAEQGDIKNAITWYETAIKASSPPPKAFYNLAMLLENFDKKIQLLKIAADRYNQAGAQFALGKFYYDNKLKASGIEGWQHYLSKAEANQHPEATELLQAIRQGKIPLPKETHFTPIKPTASPQRTHLMRSTSHSPAKTDSPPKSIKSSSPEESESPFNLEQKTSDIITQHLATREPQQPLSLSPIFSVKETPEPALLTKKQMLALATALKTRCATAPKIVEPLLPTLSSTLQKQVIDALQSIHKMADTFQSLIEQSTDQQCQKPLLQRIATRGGSIIALLETLSEVKTPEKLLEISKQLFPKKVHLPEPPPPEYFSREFQKTVQPQSPRFFKSNPTTSRPHLSETRRRCRTRLLELYTRIDKAQLADHTRREMQDNIAQTLRFVDQGTEQRLALKTLVFEAQIGCLERGVFIAESSQLKVQQSGAQSLLKFYCCACIAFNIVATTPSIIEQQHLFEAAVKPEQLALPFALDFHLKLATLTLTDEGQNSSDHMYARINDIAVEIGLLSTPKQATNTFSLE